MDTEGRAIVDMKWDRMKHDFTGRNIRAPVSGAAVSGGVVVVPSWVEGKHLIVPCRRFSHRLGKFG